MLRTSRAVWRGLLESFSRTRWRTLRSRISCRIHSTSVQQLRATLCVRRYGSTGGGGYLSTCLPWRVLPLPRPRSQLPVRVGTGPCSTPCGRGICQISSYAFECMRWVRTCVPWVQLVDNPNPPEDVRGCPSCVFHPVRKQGAAGKIKQGRLEVDTLDRACLLLTGPPEDSTSPSRPAKRTNRDKRRLGKEIL